MSLCKSGSKITYLWKSVILSAFGFSNIAFIIPSHFIIVPYFTPGMQDFFNSIRVSNSLDPDQAQHFVWPDLGPNYLQRLSAVKKKLPLAGEELSGRVLDSRPKGHGYKPHRRHYVVFLSKTH